jgi:hypothetical protein
MVTLIGWIARATGLSSLISAVIAYAVIAALAGGGFWGYGAYKHHQGYTAGSAHERAAWEKEKAATLAAQAAQKAADQAKIDQIEADYRTLQERVDQEHAEAALEAAIRKERADQKSAIPQSIAKALNEVR